MRRRRTRNGDKPGVTPAAVHKPALVPECSADLSTAWLRYEFHIEIWLLRPVGKRKQLLF